MYFNTAGHENESALKLHIPNAEFHFGPGTVTPLTFKGREIGWSTSNTLSVYLNRTTFYGLRHGIYDSAQW